MHTKTHLVDYPALGRPPRLGDRVLVSKRSARVMELVAIDGVGDRARLTWEMSGGTTVYTGIRSKWFQRPVVDYLSEGREPLLGDIVADDKGYAYVLVKIEPYTRKDGTPRRLLTWACRGSEWTTGLRSNAFTKVKGSPPLPPAVAVYPVCPAPTAHLMGVMCPACAKDEFYGASLAQYGAP